MLGKCKPSTSNYYYLETLMQGASEQERGIEEDIRSKMGSGQKPIPHQEAA